MDPASYTINQRTYALRIGIACFVCFVLIPYGVPYLWMALRTSIGHDARGAVQMIFFVIVKAGITLVFAAYIFRQVAGRLRDCGASSLWAWAIVTLLLADVVKFMTLGFQAYLMPSFLRADMMPVALGAVIALAVIPGQNAAPAILDSVNSSSGTARMGAESSHSSASTPQTFGRRA